MNRPKIIALSLVLLYMGLVSDCRCNRSTLVVKSVGLEIPQEVMSLISAQQVDTLKTQFQQIIEQDSHIRVDARLSDAGHLGISFIAPGPQSGSKGITLMVSFSQEGEAKPQEKRAFVEIPLNSGGMVESELREALSKALADLYRQSRGGKADNSVYLAKLEQAVRGQTIDVQELAKAIVIIGDRKDSSALPLLIQLLSTTDNLGVGNACLMALGEIKDPSSMQAIIEFAEHKPALIRRQAIIAARHIASRLAAEWLLVMAYGHDDPIVRKEASEALAEVEKQLGEHN